MSEFDLSGIEPYEPSTTEVLPKGNYVLKVTELDNTTSSGGYPMLKLTLENEHGRQWDNLVISPNEFSKQRLVGLLSAAGLEMPSVEQGEIDAHDGRLSDGYAYQLIDKQLGVIVREEEDNRPEYAGVMRPRVQGYVKPDVLTDATTGPLGGSQLGAQPPQQKDESPLAF